MRRSFVKNTALIWSLQTITNAKIERLGTIGLHEVVNQFSGVSIKDYGGIGGLKTVNVRSLGTNHTGVFYDGIQLGNAQNGQIDLGRFSLDNMEALQLYNGEKSDLLQTAKDYASASTVYLQTRKPLQSALTLAKDTTKSAGLKIFQKSLVLNTTQSSFQVKNSGLLCQRYSITWTSRWLTQAVLHSTL